MLTLAFARDPRSNLKGRYQSDITIDTDKLNPSDATVYRKRRYYTHWCFYMHSFERLRGLDPRTVRVILHEDMHHRLDELLYCTADFLGIDFHPSMQELTFGGKTWWGDKLYKMNPMNKPNPSVIAQKWKEELDGLDWFVLEGIFHDYFQKYGYVAYRYKGHALDRLRLFFAMLLPSKYEWEIFRFYTSPETFSGFLRDSIQEATGKVDFKDYSLHAFYRHKWSNQGIRLEKVRWHIRLVKWIRAMAKGKQGALFTSILPFLATVCYVMANALRYVASLAGFPFLVVRRAGLSLHSYLLSILGKQILPLPMVPLPDGVDPVTGKSCSSHDGVPTA